MLSNLAAGIHLVALNIGLEEIPEISSFVNPASFLDLLHLYTVMETRIKSEIMVSFLNHDPCLCQHQESLFSL